MKRKEYDEIIQFLYGLSHGLLENIINELQEKFGCMHSSETLMSICLIYNQQIQKKCISVKRLDENADHFFLEYKTRLLNLTDDQTTEIHSKKSLLLEVAEEQHILPVTLARVILRKYLSDQNSQIDGNSDAELIHVKSSVKELLKNPYLIEDTQLSYEVRQCIIHDFGSGVVTDSIRTMIGLEYEKKLTDYVKSINIPFQDEHDLRKLGYDKTPDVKLLVPFALDEQIICWIESKASFGTPLTHKQYLDDQYYSYWNRFGPGLVIYWFGFVEELAIDLKKQGILLMDHFPNKSQITWFDPKSVKTLKLLS